jgi:hypothetical protein
MEAVVQGTAECKCRSCRTGGHVLAVERPAGSMQRGLSPWCVSCHHFILTGQATKR